MRCRVLVRLLLFPLAAGAQSDAESEFRAIPAYDTAAYHPVSARPRIALNRWPAPEAGRIAVMVGTNDLTALFERDGNTLTFRSSEFALPSGSHAVRVYLVAKNEWRELAQFPLRVLTPAGFREATGTTNISISNKGQLAEGHSGTAPIPARPTYQDIGGTGGLTTRHIRGSWTMTTQMNVIGTGNRQEALRYGQLGANAARVDLSNFSLRVERPGAALSAGNVSAGTSRHLINGFASRGVLATLKRGPASLSLAAQNGSSIVGWDNITGLDQSAHRMLSGDLSLDLVPRRPGALQVTLSSLGGSVMPSAGYSQGAVLDAERSEGTSVQLRGATPGGRLQFGGGQTSSQFRNEADRQLQGDAMIVAAPARRRSARYGELTLGLLQNQRLPIGSTASLNATARHERVDPLYRSVASWARADVDENAYQLTGSVDAISLQAGTSRSHDNLDHVPSILTTKNENSTAQVSVPLAGLLRISRAAWLLPAMSASWNWTRQFGVALPDSSGFQASHVPDQMSAAHEVSAQWQGGRSRFGYRHSRSLQDNRQVGRQASDLAAWTHAFTLGHALHPSLDINADASLEYQENRELGQTARTQRISLSANWRARATTGVSLTLGTSRTDDEPRTTANDQMESRVEITHRFDVLAQPQSEKRGQLFVRYASQSQDITAFGDPMTSPPAQNRGAWTVSSGLTFRLF